MSNKYHKEIEIMKSASLDCILRLSPKTLDCFPEEMQEFILESFETLLENNTGSKEQFAEMFRIRFMLKGIYTSIRELEDMGAIYE